jgi:hypothetical protein
LPPREYRRSADGAYPSMLSPAAHRTSRRRPRGSSRQLLQSIPPLQGSGVEDFARRSRPDYAQALPPTERLPDSSGAARLCLESGLVAGRGHEYHGTGLGTRTLPGVTSETPCAAVCHCPQGGPLAAVAPSFKRPKPVAVGRLTRAHKQGTGFGCARHPRQVARGEILLAKSVGNRPFVRTGRALASA